MQKLPLYVHLCRRVKLETTHHKEEDLVAAFNRACYKHNEGYITMHPYIYDVCREYIVTMNRQMGDVFYITRAIDYAN